MFDNRRARKSSLLPKILLGTLIAAPAFGGVEGFVDSVRKKLFDTPSRSEVPQQLGGDLAVLADEKGFAATRDAQKRLCFSDEGVFLDIRRQTLQRWTNSWRAKDATVFSEILDASNVAASAFAEASGPVRTNGAVRVWRHSDGSLLKGKAAIERSVRSYLGKFEKVEDFRIDVMKMAASNDQRFSDLRVRSARLSGFYDLRAVEKGGVRRQDRGPVEIVVRRETAEAPWKIAEVRMGAMETLRSSQPSFVNRTVESGLGKAVAYERLEAIRRGGFALAVADYNGDGINDMYYGAYGRGQLFAGRADGTFVEDTTSGIGSHDRVKSAVFADFDNDGRQDLALVRFAGQQSASANGYAAPGEEILVYHNDGKGKFQRATNVTKTSRTRYAMPATTADFNGDGLLDLYVGFPGVKDFTSSVFDMPSREVAVEGLFYNRGKLAFEMKPVLASAGAERSAAQMLYPHSALAVDFDQDGDMDIVVVDDRGNLSPAYLNDGAGRFMQAQAGLAPDFRGYGMGVAAADYDGDGIVDLVFTNVNTVAATRITQSCEQNWGFTFPMAAQNAGVRLFKGLGGGRFTETTNVAGLAWAGEGLAGAEFVDYNNDGLPDLVVSNGLWSGTSQEQDLGSVFFAQASGLISEQDMDERTDGTVSPMMETLAKFRGELYFPGAKRDTQARPHLAGMQRKRLFRNTGDGRFLEVGYLENLDSLADGYVLAKADVNGDGKVDIVFRNGDHGTKDVSFAPVEYFENRNREGGKHLRLTLVGNGKSNRDAIGAEVKVRVGKRWMVQQVTGVNGAVQSERTVHFGLGQAIRADQVVIRWPSGTTQQMHKVNSGSYRITEGNVPTLAQRSAGPNAGAL